MSIAKVHKHMCYYMLCTAGTFHTHVQWERHVLLGDNTLYVINLIIIMTFLYFTIFMMKTIFNPLWDHLYTKNDDNNNSTLDCL